MLLPGSDGVSLADDEVCGARFRRMYNVVVARSAAERTAGSKISGFEMGRDKDAISLWYRRTSTKSTMTRTLHRTHDSSVKLSPKMATLVSTD